MKGLLLLLSEALFECACEGLTDIWPATSYSLPPFLSHIFLQNNLKNILFIKKRIDDKNKIKACGVRTGLKNTKKHSKILNFTPK